MCKIYSLDKKREEFRRKKHKNPTEENKNSEKLSISKDPREFNRLLAITDIIYQVELESKKIPFPGE